MELHAQMIIIGPPCSGKTLNAAALAEHYGCDCVWEEGVHGGRGAKPLVLLTEGLRHPAEPMLTGPKISVDVAKKALGGRWVEPVV